MHPEDEWGRIVACSYCVQWKWPEDHRPRAAYCTQQTGGLTRGMALRARQTAEPLDDPEWITAILALAAEIRQGTIDRIMDKSDLELGSDRPPP